MNTSLAFVVAMLMCGCVTSCGDNGGRIPIGCDFCPTDCWRDTVCDDGGCHLVDIACATTCTSDGACGDGQACVEHDGVNRCSPYCTGSRCRSGFDCVGDPRSSSTQCLPVSCGANNPCAAAGTFCELFDHECYPVSGICSANQPCPAFGGAATAASCGNDGFCHVQVPPLSAVAVNVAQMTAPITVTAPAVGQIFSSQAQMDFTWTDTGAPTITLVLDAPPMNVAALDNARWGAAIVHGNTADWSHGHAIVDGGWQAGPGSAPLGTPLYFVVEALSDGKLVALSTAIPFAVASGWKQPFAACTREDEVPGDCQNPAFPSACHLHLCQVLCASQRDCDTHTETQGLACALPVALDGDPRPSARFCQ